VLAIGALPVRRLAQVTPILCDTAPFQLEPTLKHVSVSAACEVALVITCCHQNIASHWHGDNHGVAALRSQFLLQIPVMLISHNDHEGVSWASTWRTLELRAVDFVCVEFRRHGTAWVAAEEEGEVVVVAAAMQPCLVEADFMADSRAVAACASEHW